MADPTPLGIWLRRERERRGMTLKQISDQTKVAVPHLEGLETGDLSRWPGGIFRRGFVRAYATAVGLDADEVVRRFEETYPATDVAPLLALDPELRSSSTVEQAVAAEAASTPASVERPREARSRRQAGSPPSRRTRVLGALADLMVAAGIGLGFAAGGSRLLWPVLAVAAYHALGAVLTGTTPMIALLRESETPRSVGGGEDPSAAPRRNDRRQSRRSHRTPRTPRKSRAGTRIR